MSMTLKKSPLAQVRDDFGGKDKAVDKIVGVLDVGDEGKDALRKRLLGVANRKLIRLHAVATRTKQLGGHDKLADLHERLGPDPIDAPLGFEARLHEAGLAQHAEVLGHRSLRHPQPAPVRSLEKEAPLPAVDGKDVTGPGSAA